MIIDNIFADGKDGEITMLAGESAGVAGKVTARLNVPGILPSSSPRILLPSPPRCIP
jgi:hypothetical protein